MKKRSFFAALLALTTLAGCGTSTGTEAGVGAAGYATPEATPAVHENEEEVASSWDAGYASALAVPADYYFRDSTGAGSVGGGVVIDYVEEARPYTQTRDFSDYTAELTAAALPSVDFDNCSITGFYREDGSIWGLNLLWQADAETTYRQMTLAVWRSQPTEADHDDNYNPVDTSKMTRTVVRTPDEQPVEVYGELHFAGGAGATDTEILARTLVWTMPDGSYCQLTALKNSPAGELVSVLDFVLTHGIDYDAFAMDRGDEWSNGDLADYPEAFPGCVPVIDDEAVSVRMQSVALKNGEPVRLTIAYQADWGGFDGEENWNDVFLWHVGEEPEAWDADLGPAENVTQEALYAALDEADRQWAELWVGDRCIRVEPTWWAPEGYEPLVTREDVYRWIWQAVRSLQETEGEA